MRGVVAVRGLFSLDGFLPDVAEGGGGVWQNWFTAQPDGVRDSRGGEGSHDRERGGWWWWANRCWGVGEGKESQQNCSAQRSRLGAYIPGDEPGSDEYGD